MAVTSIWHVKSGGLGRVLDYAKNKSKTTEYAGEQEKWLSDVITYATKDKKTQAIVHDEHNEIMRQFVSGVNCQPETVRDEMQAVKRKFGKTDGVIAYHGYQSFAPGEATPEMAHEIGVKLADRLWGNKYQVIVTTHLDKAHHLHNHFVRPDRAFCQAA